MDSKLILFGVLIFAAVGLLVAGIYMGWQTTKSPEAERVARRLRNAIGDNGSELAVSITKERVYSRAPELQRLLVRLPGIARLDRLLLQTGRGWTVARLCGIMLGTALAGLVASSFLGLPWFGSLGLTVLGAVLPLFEAAHAKSSRIIRIEHSLPDALDMMNRAMRAGHAFPSTLKMVSEEIPDPLGGEFRAVFDEVNFGVSMSDALTNLAQRVPSTDLRYFVIAVLIQRETGGNLTDLLGSISTIIRDRLKLLGQVRVMTAEGRMSAWVLGLLPFGVGATVAVTNPGFLDTLFTDPIGRQMITTAAIMMVVAVLIIRRLTKIRV